MHYNKLRVLFLDDNPVRHQLFRKWLSNADHCFTYEECVKLLSLTHYDVASLDHDLSETDEMCLPGVNNKARTGTDIAEFIARQANRPKLVVVHSFNPIGAQTMCAILSRVGVGALRVPFGFDPKIYTSLEIK